MNVVATAPSPGVRMPSFPVARAGGVRTSGEDGKTLSPLGLGTPRRVSRRRRGFVIEDAQRRRDCIEGGATNERDSLNRCNPGGQGEYGDDAHQQLAIERQT